jgi:D-3-phosphoglycerate dehydrogenase
LIAALQSGKILGAGLDVLEYETSSFEKITNNLPALEYLKQAKNVILTPHIAGWTVESHQKLAQVIVNKIINFSTQKQL